MSRKYKFHNPEGVYFVSFAVQSWVDVFTRNVYKDILIENLIYCQNNKGLEIFAWCIMTNHVHLMIRAKEGYLLQDIVRDFKKFSCKAVIKAIKENYEESRKEWLLKQLETKEGYSLWRGDNKPIELWSNAVITQKLNYIHQNPVEEGLVFKAEDYMYSSAYDYTGENGMIDILVIDQVEWHGSQTRASVGKPEKVYVSGGLDRNNYPKYVYTHKPEVITNGKYDISIIVTTDKKSLKIKLTKK